MHGFAFICSHSSALSSIPLPHSLHGLLYVTASSLSLIAEHFPCQLSFPIFPNPLPPSPTLADISLLPSCAVPLPSTCSSLASSSSPPFLPSITCVHAVRGGVLIPRLADRHSNGRRGLCVRVCVYLCTPDCVLVGCLRTSHGNNSSARVDGCWAGGQVAGGQVGRRAGAVRSSSASL